MCSRLHSRLLAANWKARLEHLERLRRKAKAEKADFREANLRAAHLEEAILNGARFQKARLQSAHLDRAELVGAHFQQADLNDAYFVDATLDESTLRTITRAVNWERAHFSPADAQRLDDLMAPSSL